MIAFVVVAGVAAEEAADDGEEDEDEVEIVPAFTDKMWSEKLRNGGEEGRDDEEDYEDRSYSGEE